MGDFFGIGEIPVLVYTCGVDHGALLTQYADVCPCGKPVGRKCHRCSQFVQLHHVHVCSFLGASSDESTRKKVDLMDILTKSPDIKGGAEMSANVKLSEGEVLELPEPECLMDAIENGIREAAFSFYGVHATADVIKQHIDKFVASLSKEK